MTHIDHRPGTPGMTLWQYGERVLDNWKEAEAELARAARWMALFGAAQVLTLFNYGEFGPESPTTTLAVFGVDVTVPGYWLAVSLPVIAGYWVSQYLHSWVGTKALLTVHRAVFARLVAPDADADTRGPEADDPLDRGHPGHEADDLQTPLIPAASIAGRLPTRFGNVWRDKVGTRWNGLTVVLCAVAFEGVVYARLWPFGIGFQFWIVAVWFLSTAFTACLLVYSSGFIREPQRWKQPAIEAMLDRLEKRNAIGR
jgi:hypothetical protein